MTSEDFAYALVALLDNVEPGDELESIASVLTYRDAGVMTTNDGVVVKLDDGAEFQVQIVQSRYAS